MPPRSHVYDKGVEPVPGYRLTDYLGGGTFGEVWKTIDLSTSKHFALKIIDLSYSSSALKELRALKLVMNLNHPNLVPITKAWLKDKHGQSLDLHTVDFVRQKGKLKLLLILMGLGEKSLSARLKEVNRAAGDPDHEDDEALTRGIPPDELTNYMLGAAKGIDYLNAARHEGVDPASDGPIVHCDIKPDNMMIVAGTEVQIADCGVAVSLNQDTRKTVSAAFSPVYAPPELTTNRPSTGTDQYSLAISYYELRTGRRPFADGMNQLEMMTAHSLGDLDFSSLTLTPGELKVIKWATSPRIAERYPSCLDMVKQLERAIEGLTPKAPGDVLQKSAPVLLVAAAPPAAIALPAPRSPALGDTHEHNIDLFTPPPVFAATSEATTALVPEPAAKATGSRPVILINRDDPMGGELPEPELDQELQEIIRGSQVVAHPASRKPFVEPPARPNPPGRPPAVVDLVETDIRPDTDPEPVEPARSRRAAPPSRYDGTVVPGDRSHPQRLGLKAPDPVSWKDPPAGAKKKPTTLIAVAVAAVLLVGGGVGAFVMLSPSGRDSQGTAATAAKSGGETPVTEKSGGETPSTKPTTPPTELSGPTPMPTAREFFAKKLAALSPDLKDVVQLNGLFADSTSDSLLRKLLVETLIGDGKDDQRLATLADFATANDKWADLSVHRDALAVAWFQVKVQPAYDEALQCLDAKPTPETVATKIEALRAALALPTAVKVLGESPPGSLKQAAQLNAVATAWQNAKESPKEFLKELAQETPPPGGKFFAAEYFKIARAANAPIGELRDLRDKTNSWSGIDASYQTALAEFVQEALLVESPKWSAIAATCEKDSANGWTALAAAEGQLRTSTNGAAKLPRLPDGTDDSGKQFVRYLKCYASQDPDGLVGLYKDAKSVSPLLNVKSRKLVAAGIILKGTPLLKGHRDWEGDPVKFLFTNPYEGEADLVAKANRLDTAARLSGQWGKAERMHRYLISVALKSPDKSLTAGLKVGEGVVKDEHRAAALAYSMAVFGDETLSNAARVKAAAAAARLAFQQLEFSFDDCKTDKETNDRQEAMATRIQGEITKKCLAILGNDAGPDAKSVRFSDVRADVLLKKLLKPDRLDKVAQCAKDVAGETDEAAALGLLALSRYSDTYRDVVGEPAKAAAWELIKSDAKRALDLDAKTFYASLVMNFLDSSEYKGETIILGVKPPVGAVIATDQELDRAIRQFAATATSLNTRKQSSFHSMRSRFLAARADELEKAGKDEKVVEGLRKQIADSNKLEAEQKNP